MADTTTIRLPPELRARLASLAEQQHRSVHSLIVEAIERHAAHEEELRELVRAALAEDAQIEQLGRVYGAEDVHAWVRQFAANEPAPRPQQWRK